MPILSASTALTVYKLDAPSAITAEKLKTFAFRSIDDIPDATSWGWTSIENIFDCGWRESVPEKGPFMCFAFRVDTRKVAPAVLKKHLAEAFREEEAKNQAEGKEYISRARKKELKELHTAKLLKRAEPVPVSVDLALDTASGLLYVATTSKAMLERIEEQLTSFEVSATRMVLAGLEEHHDIDDQALETLFQNIHKNGLSVHLEGHSYTVSEFERITLTGDGEVAVKSMPSGAGGCVDASIEAGLQAGLSISKMQMRIEQDDDPALTWELTLDREFGFSGLKTPHVDKADHDADPDAVILEKLYLIDQAVQVMHALFREQIGA